MNFIMGNELKENNSLLRDIVVMIKKIKKKINVEKEHCEITEVNNINYQSELSLFQNQIPPKFIIYI